MFVKILIKPLLISMSVVSMECSAINLHIFSTFSSQFLVVVLLSQMVSWDTSGVVVGNNWEANCFCALIR